MDEMEQRVNTPSERYDIYWNPQSKFYNRDNPRYKRIKNRGKTSGK